MTLCKIPLTNRSEVEFNIHWVAGSGREKTGFYTPDANRVLLFFKKNLSDRAARMERLQRMIDLYNPTKGKNGNFWKSHFCWPEGIIDGAAGLPEKFLERNGLATPALGVVVPVPQGNVFFEGQDGNVRLKSIDWFIGEKTRKRMPDREKGTFAGFLQCCAMLARAVRRLHLDGLAHGDLSSRNVIIDPKGGLACMIDLDSLVVPTVDPPTVSGTHGYIAPEVVAAKAKPSIETDLHALAVLIYECLLFRHPLMGPKKRSDDPDEDSLLELGKDALFIEHPTDFSNRPAPPPAVPFTRLGPHLEAVMRGAFIDGLHTPSRRPTSGDWERALYRTVDMLHPTPDGKDWQIVGPELPMTHPATGEAFKDPIPCAAFFRRSPRAPYEILAEPSGHCLAVYNGLQLMHSHVFTALPSEETDPLALGYFVKEEGIWYLVNESDEIMTVEVGPSLARRGFVEIKEGMSIVMSQKPNARTLRFRFLRPSPPSSVKAQIGAPKQTISF